MKHLSVRFILGVLILVSLFTLGFQKVLAPEKTYSVSLTKEQWQSRINFIQNAMIAMRSSTYPANQIAAGQDSLMLFEQEINKQVSAQIAADTLKKK